MSSVAARTGLAGPGPSTRARTDSVALVARPGDRATGLGRYASSLGGALTGLGITVHSGQLVNPVPQLLTRLLARSGQDAETFFSVYGLRANVPAADVYHLTNESQASLLLVRRLRPAVVTVQGFLTFLLRNHPHLRMHTTFTEAVFDRLVILGLRNADAVIAVSNYLKQQLVEQAGLSSNSIHVIPEGVDTDLFSPRQLSGAERAQLGLQVERRWILYVGSEQPRKNFVSLVRAFAEVHHARPDVGLLKVGQAEVKHERERAISVAHALGVAEHIRFVDHTSTALPQLYSTAALFVFPSLNEGFGLPPLEAMACGVPVVCSNAASLPEVVGDAALMCDATPVALARAMARVLDSPTLAGELSLRGQARARMLSWSRAAKTTAELYAEIAERHRFHRRPSR